MQEYKGIRRDWFYGGNTSGTHRVKLCMFSPTEESNCYVYNVFVIVLTDTDFTWSKNNNSPLSNTAIFFINTDTFSAKHKPSSGYRLI